MHARSGARHRVEVVVRPHPLAGTVDAGDEARAIVVLVSSARLPAASAAMVAVQSQLGASLGVAHFDGLWAARRADTDPLSSFDTQLLAARLVSITDALVQHPHLGRFRIGYLALGCAAAAAVEAAVERPAAVNALVLVEAVLVASSASLPELTAPTLSLQSDRQDDGFLATRRLDRPRVLRVVDEGRALWSAGHLDAVAHHARLWFERHLLTMTPLPTGVAAPQR